MDPHTPDIDTVRSIRTFADDVRRAQGVSGADRAEEQNKKQKSSPTQKKPQPIPKRPIPPKKEETQEERASSREVHKPEPQPSESTHEQPQPKQEPSSLQRTFESIQRVSEAKDKARKKQATQEKAASDTKNESTETELDTASGTIIRDNVRKRWTLTGALKEAFSSWFKEKRRTLTGGGEPARPDVAPASHRANIIKKAGTYSTIAPQDDYDSVLDNLRSQKGKKGITQGSPESSASDDETSKDAKTETTASNETQNADQTSENKKKDTGWTHIIEEAVADDTGNAQTQTPSSIKKARPRVTPSETKPEESVRREHVLSNEKNAVAPVQKGRADEQEYLERHQKDTARTSASAPEGASDVAPEVERAGTGAQDTQHTRTMEEDVQHAQATGTEEKKGHTTEQRDRYREDPNVQEASPAPIPQKQKESEMRGQGEAPATVRTYRDDAIKGVEERKLSVPKIAAAQAKRRAQRGGESTASRSKTNTSSVVLVASLIVALLLGGGAGYLWMQRDVQTTPATVTRIPSFVGSIEQKSIGFSEDRSELMDILTEAVSSLGAGSNTLTQLYPSHQNGTEEEIVTTDAFMDVLDPQTSSSFVRSLTNNMMFGAYTGRTNEPFFVFKTEHFDVALAGMLAWEEAMSADLSPLFGPPVRRTFDPTAFTSDGARDAMFVDETIRNTNVRILYDELGEARILYAFPDRETIVITTSTEALVALFEALR